MAAHFLPFLFKQEIVFHGCYVKYVLGNQIISLHILLFFIVPTRGLDYLVGI